MRLSTSYLLLALGGFAALSTAARAEPLADPTGVWLVEDGQARIRIEHCGKPQDKICGFIVWSKDMTPTLDEKNPDPTKRSRQVFGSQLILGLDPEEKEYSGHLYNADNGKTYDVHVWRDDDTNLTLKGCVMTYLCQSQKWTKVDDVLPGQLTGATDADGGPRSDPAFMAPAGAGHPKGDHKKKKAPKPT